MCGAERACRSSSLNGCSVCPGVTSNCPLQVDCLVLQLHRVGEQLEKMNRKGRDEHWVVIRDGFLLPSGLSSLAQVLLPENHRISDSQLEDDPGCPRGSLQ